MAIWGNSYIHGILDSDNGYYVSPYHYNAASYDNDNNAIIFGSNEANTDINGNSISINALIDTELLVDNNIKANTYEIYVPAYDSYTGGYIKAIDINNNISDRNRSILLGVDNNIDSICIGNYSNDIYLDGTVTMDYGDLYLDTNTSIIYHSNAYNHKAISYNNHTLIIGNTNDDPSKSLNTKITGNNIIFDDTCYGTDDPPINGVEGQIYFKIIS